MNSLNLMLIFRMVLSQVAFFKLRNGWNRRTIWSRVLSGVHFLEVLAYLLPLWNEDTRPVTPSYDILGCDNSRVWLTN
ncbi:hypothetical protein Hanom_Chr15g01407281 [Helianthus anomalus]